jgi:hypothetical protein
VTAVLGLDATVVLLTPARSLGHAARFVGRPRPVPILLVWPGRPEGTGGPPPV